MSDTTPEIKPLSTVPESKEAQQTASQESLPPVSPDEGKVRAENRENREGLTKKINDPDAELEQGIAAMAQPAGAKPTPQTGEEDLGTNKTAMDKISDGMQKAFEMVQKFMKQIQSMGASTLRGMASTLGMLGFKKAAEWLNEMAGADFAELTSALKKGNLQLSAISPEDPEAKAKGEAAERGQAQLADRYKVLAQTRGPTFSREMYYSEVVTAWKKKGGNGSKTEITHNDLLDMAVTAQELPPVLPGQVAQAPEFVPPIESVTAPLNVMGPAPAKVQVRGKAVSLQVLPTGEWNIAVGPTGAPVRYRMAPGNNANVPSWLLKTATLSADGLRFEGRATYQDNTAVEYSSPKLVAMADIRAFLEKVADNPNNAQHTGTEFRFERIPA
ncbi:hypothetical protein AUJ46_00320 [Candidatus Peregrinibacteria bacterium CG1_02_54_53]|nr:MAG: hypothetical protein AUJ46_00320 [Candidatus Peregrinibacteria bacterium CG1_02_54_53]